MTVYRETVIHVYGGTSDDAKPDDCPPGSRFYEFDTTTLFLFDGTDWRAQP